MKELIIIDNNSIPRVTSRDIAKMATYQHISVKQHIEKIIKEKKVVIGQIENLFKRDIFKDSPKAERYEQYLISLQGLKLLREYKERYADCRPLALALHEAELEIMEKGFVEAEPKLTLEQPKQIKPIEEDLYNENGQIVVSSRMVAERFGKRHDNVVRAIEEKISTNSKLRALNYYIESSYIDGKGESRKEYLMTRDGFTFTVMGFTGKEADDFKVAYIEAFNKMEEELKAQALDPVLPPMPTTYKDALIALVAEVEAKEKLQLENKVQQEVIQELKPKSEYCDMVLKAHGTLPISVIAKDYGMTGQRMNSLLRELGIQFKQGDRWLLYSEHDDKGYVKSETYVVEGRFGLATNVSTKWTQRGRMFIYELLKEKRGLLPIIERGDM